MKDKKSPFSIKNWAEDDRPREKMLLKGKKALSNAELIAILIGSGNSNESAVNLAKRILSSIDFNLQKLAKMRINEFTQFKGIGIAKAVSIVTALELGRRHRLQQALELPKITKSKDAFNTMQPIIGELNHEEFWVVFLNNAQKIIETEQQSKGGLTSTVIDIRLIFKKALEINATKMILCHNHPSGMLQPSNEDISVTKKLKDAGKTLNIQVIDHLIITENAYFSFADEGIL